MFKKEFDPNFEQFSKQSLAKFETDYTDLFIEITKCGEKERSWKSLNGKNVPILKHPVYPSYSRLHFIHLYDFLIKQIELKGLSLKDFKIEIESTPIQWETFYRGQYRPINPDKVEVGICTAARFMNIPLILLLVKFLEDCGDDAKKIRLDAHQAYEKTISSFLRDAKHIASQQTSNQSQQQKEEPEQSLDERTETIDGLELVSGEDKWLDPYNLSDITFVARDAELESLNQFVKHNDKFKIWAIEGPSGAGKTRLTIEWINRSQEGILKGWKLRILHKQDRFDLDYWSSWVPYKPTLIVIDYMFGFDQVIAKLIHCCSNSLPYKVRLLVLDHVFSRPIHNDTRWGFSLDRSSLNRNESHFYDLNPLDISEPDDQETVIRGIICQRAAVNNQNSAVMKAIDYLKETKGAWHPLFAVLVGEALQAGLDFTQWNRRELIDYYLTDKRLPWKLDDELNGRWAGYFISVATARRGVTYRYLIKASSACQSSPEHFGTVKEICRHIVADNHSTMLIPFEPDILGESFFLQFLKYLEDSVEYQKVFREIFLAGDSESQVRDAIEFIGFIDRLTRNLLNDDQNQLDIQTSWQALFLFLQPENFPKSNILRWAVCIALVFLIFNIKQTFPIEILRKLFNQIKSLDIYQVEDSIPLSFLLFISMSLIDISKYLGETEKEKEITIDILNFLNNQGANTDLVLFNGDTILMQATVFGLTDMVDNLLKIGVDVHALNKGGKTALYFASGVGNTSIVKLLLDYGASVDSSDDKGKTALMRACNNGHLDVIKMLLYRGAKVNSSDDKGTTALMIACAAGHNKVVELLLENGADANSSNDDGWTALMWASAIGKTEIVKLLLSRGADIDSLNNVGRTALICACAIGQTKVVEMLVNQGADINLRDNKGFSAIEWAFKNFHFDTVKILLVNDNVKLIR